MITASELERLAKLESDDGIVSLYIRLEPRLMYERGLAATKFKSAMKRFGRRETKEKWREAAERERERIESFLSEWGQEGDGRALALFACEPDDVWEVVPLEAASIPTTLSVSRTTQTRPLTVLLDEYPRLVTCVVQRDRATLYVSEQEERSDTEQISSDVHPRHAKGGWSQQRWARHIELQVDRHLGGVVEAIEELDREQEIGHLVLGGTTEVTTEVEEKLPEGLRARCAGSMPVDVKHTTPEEILQGALEVSQSKERELERGLVRMVIGQADSRAPTIVGLDETLRAITEERVEVLVLDEDLDREGYECVACSYFAASRAEECPVCGGATETLENVIDIAVEKAFTDGASVNFVFDETAKEELLDRGGIGALLRY